MTRSERNQARFFLLRIYEIVRGMGWEGWTSRTVHLLVYHQRHLAIENVTKTHTK